MNQTYKFHYYLSQDEWLLQENSFAIESQTSNESLFTLGNGYLGSRGVYEEKPLHSHPGTYFSGIYNHREDACAELINAPNPFFFSISVNDEKINLYQTQVEAHQRTLDMLKGLLHRQTIFRVKTGTLIDYQSLRFLSMADPHIAAMTVDISCLNQDENIDVDLSLDVDVFNLEIIAEAARLFRIVAEEHFENIHLLTMQSLDGRKEITIAVQALINYKDLSSVMPTFKMTIPLSVGIPLVITKIVAFMTSGDIQDSSQRRLAVINKIKNAVATTFSIIIQQHVKAWANRWDKADIQVVGDLPIQHALRFNLYQLLIVANTSSSINSVAAKMLSGEGYLGHIFWEAEILLLPAYLAFEPHIARNFLEYRFLRLSAAIKNSEQLGYEGALYPWESAETGFEETPHWSVDLDGTKVPVFSGKYEIHINLAIFYGIYNYYQATGDVDFMLEKGLPMMILMSRFWRSRVVYHRKNAAYSINHVMGPDEFHVDVNNNYYTNRLVSWSFVVLVELMDKLTALYPKAAARLTKKYRFTQSEQAKLIRISDNIYLPQKDKLLLQFENYLSQRACEKLALNAQGLPIIPADILVSDLGATQYVKQPEIILLFMMLPSLFTEQTMKANFEYYDSRTLHKSSWSPPVSSAVAAQLGYLDKACHYFQIAIQSDLNNLFNNTQAGLHAPTVGGVWNALIRGFCGICYTDQALEIKPNLPKYWQSVTFTLFYRGFYLRCGIQQNEVNIELEDGSLSYPKNDHIKVKVAGKIRTLRVGKHYRLHL